MFDKIIAFFMSIIAFFMQLFGISVSDGNVLKDVAYGKAERQVVDIYLPEKTENPVGLVVLIHGGAWVAGDKSGNESACEYISESLGLVAATVNYRYINDSVHCEDMLEDIDNAVTKVKEVAAENGFEISAAAYGGHSAGGHLAMMYAYTYAEKSAVPVAFCFDQSGPSDMSDENFFSSSNALGLENVFSLCTWLTGTQVNAANLHNADIQNALDAVSPLSYITSSTVPTIICHGDSDDIVPYSNAVSLDNALTAAGVKHDFITYKNTGHGLDNDSSAAAAYDKIINEYVNMYLR